jgi:membrane peptidoglycan carboxypeptidase
VGYFGGQSGVFNVTNSEGPGTTTDSLYTGTTGSINVFFAHLEQKVGLCNTVKTAVNLGVTRVDGKSLLKADGPGQPAADDLPSFTLGVVNVSPMSMAAAYAVPASNGIYCKPIVLTKIVDGQGHSLPVPSAGCHRAISAEVAQAVNYILQGVFGNGGTAAGMGLADHQAAGKTGTSNVANGNGTPFAAFAGYTTSLVGYVSVFNPLSPTTKTMTGYSACYQQEFGGQTCPGEMFGANAPATTWHMTFDHADLSKSGDFQPVPQDSSLWSQGDGQTVKQPKKPGKGGHGGGNNGGGGGNGGPGGGGGGNGGPGGGGGGNGGGLGGGPITQPFVNVLPTQP